jgi:hypothetical protein
LATLTVNWIEGSSVLVRTWVYSVSVLSPVATISALWPGQAESSQPSCPEGYWPEPQESDGTG